MQLEHEIATSRYLYGRDYGLVFHLFPYRTNVATWDVTTYNKYATSRGVPPYDPAAIDPHVRYDPAKGGKKPYPLQTEIEESYFLAKLAGKEPASDSASAATAWATGYKTDDGNLAWLPGDVSGGALKTIAELVRDEKGMAIGVVSTVPFTHATPAAHVSHNVNRNNYHAIADEIMKNTRPEVVIGGGYPFGGSFTYISQQLYTDIKNNTGNMFADYVSLERASGVDGGKALLAAAKQAKREGKRMFGLFGGAGGNLESPVPTDTPGTPSISRGSSENPLLKDCVVAALEVLGRDKDGFSVMIEQGDIDWANHAGDFPRMVGTIWGLDMAVREAIAFVDRPGDSLTWGNTLLVVTPDDANNYLRFGTSTLGKGVLPAVSAGDLMKEATRRKAGTWASDQIPRSRGEIRPSGETAVASVSTKAAPPIARLPRWTKCQSSGMLLSLLYWHMGETKTRFLKVISLHFKGENNLIMLSPSIENPTITKGTVKQGAFVIEGAGKGLAR